MNKILKKMPEYMSNGTISGSACAYKRLGVYNDCSRTDTTPIMSDKTFTSASQVERDTTNFVSDYVNKATPTLGVTEGYAEPNFTPSYTVPEYRAITTDALTHGNKANNCGGYFSIMSAYGDDAGSCNVSYIKM